MERRSLLQLACAIMPISLLTARAEAATPDQSKVAYHLSDLDKVDFVLGNIRNHYNGMGGPDKVTIALVVHGPALKALTLPAIALAMPQAALLARVLRQALIDTLHEDYIRTARAKGLLRRIIINRHALKNALLPVVTLLGIEFAFLIGGLVVTEQVFNLNGIGRLFVLAVQNQDYTLTQALVMLVVAIFVLTNLAVDLLYAWLDPRIRFA